jgi:outer membrane autotransporter protein
MLNGYLDANNDSRLTPYLMAGIGVGHNRSRIAHNSGSESANKTNFIWNAGVGVQAAVNKQVSVDLSYRYVDIGKLGNKAVCDGKAKLKRGIHEFLIGLVYNFDKKKKTKHKNNFALFNAGFMRS